MLEKASKPLQNKRYKV